MIIRILKKLDQRNHWFSEPVTVLTRLGLAQVFVVSGWGKLHHIDKVIDFFTSLGIPFAHLQAPFVAAVEFFGGVAILLGLGARWVSFALMVTMAVAIRTAKWEEIAGFGSLLETTEFLYLLLLAWIVARGAGRLSVDHWIRKRIGI